MEEGYRRVSDEQLVRLAKHNFQGAYNLLLERCLSYTKYIISEIIIKFNLKSYDENFLYESASETMLYALANFDSKKGLFKKYFLKNVYYNFQKLVKDQKNKEVHEVSMDDRIHDGESDLIYEDIIYDESSEELKNKINEKYKFYLLSQSQNTTLKKVKVQAVVTHRMYGKSIRQISKIMNISVKKVRNILDNENVKRFLKKTANFE